MITLFLVSVFTACERNPILPEPIESVKPTPVEEDSMFDLQWVTRMDEQNHQIQGTDNTQQYKDLVIIGGDWGLPPQIMAFDKDSGEKVWDFVSQGSVEDDIVSSVIVGNIYVGVCYDGIVGINLDNQTLAWEIDLKPQFRKTGRRVSLHNGKVYTTAVKNWRTPSQSESIVEINPLNGFYQYIYTIHGTYIGHPVFYENDNKSNTKSIIINEYPGDMIPPDSSIQNIMRIDLNTGQTIWKQNAFTDFYSSNQAHPPVIYNDIVITGGDWSLYAFDANTGEKLWRTEIPGALQVGNWFFTNHLIHNDKLYANPDGFHLLCLDPLTGDILWYNNEVPRSTNNMTYYEEEDYLVFSDAGSVLIIDAITGETLHEENGYDWSKFGKDIIYDKSRDMFFTSTLKDAVGFKINAPE